MEEQSIAEGAHTRHQRVPHIHGTGRHLEETMLRIGFLDPKAPRLLMRRMRRLFNRAQLEQVEVKILRGLLGAALGAKKPRQ